MSNSHNNLEEYVKNMYAAINVSDRGDLRPDVIINRLGYSLQYAPVRSMRIDNTVYLDSRLPQNTQWQEFARLLCHLLLHPQNALHSTPELDAAQGREAEAFAVEFLKCIQRPIA